MSDDLMGDEIIGADELLGDDVGDDLVVGADDLLGDDLLVGGDDLLGDDILGDDIIGDDLVAGDDIIGALRRKRKRRRQVIGRALKRNMALKNAIMAKKLASAKVVETRKPTKARIQSFGFLYLGVAPGQTVDIPARPQVLFRGTRLIVPSAIAPFFSIEDIKVGRSSQFVASGPQPAEAYKDTATNENVSLDTCKPGMDIVLKVSNFGGTAADFRAALFGDVVE